MLEITWINVAEHVRKGCITGNVNICKSEKQKMEQEICKSKKYKWYKKYKRCLTISSFITAIAKQKKGIVTRITNEKRQKTPKKCPMDQKSKKRPN